MLQSAPAAQPCNAHSCTPVKDDRDRSAKLNIRWASIFKTRIASSPFKKHTGHLKKSVSYQPITWYTIRNVSVTCDYYASSKGPFIATQLNSTPLDVELSWVASAKCLQRPADATQLNWVELCRYKRAFTQRIDAYEFLFVLMAISLLFPKSDIIFVENRDSFHISLP